MKKIIRYIFLIILAGGIVFHSSCKKERLCENCINGNQPPTAIAGPDQVITLPTDSVSLDGRQSSDPDGKISEWLWTKISGPASFTIIKPTDSTTKVKVFVTGTYQFELKVKDNGGLFTKDTVQVIVNDPTQPNRSPIANAGPDQTITLPVNTTTLDGNGSTDPDNNITSYTWVKISGPSSFNIANANVVQTQVTNLVQGIYQFELKVTDAGGLFAKDTMQVIVNDLPNNQAPVANAGPDQKITLPLDSTWLDGSGSSPNGWSVSTTVTYVWTKISGPAQFLLSPATIQQTLQRPGYVPTTAIVKNLIPGTYLFRLQVTNSYGAFDADTVQVIVVDDPLNPNTVTYHDLVWAQGDAYGLGLVDIFLTTSINPSLFYGINAYRPVQVYLNLDSSASWILVPDGGNNIYTYDEFPLLLWIICYPNNPLLVGRKSSIKIKFL
jgi:hypothetical protein